MIFQYTIDKVLSGEKTLTSCIVKPGHSIGRIAYGTPMEFMPNNAGWGDIIAVRQNGRDVYALNKTYPAQPGRGKPSVARIRLLSIRRYDVRNITDDEARREGFVRCEDFLLTWVKMHDRSREWYRNGYLYHYWRGRAFGWQVAGIEDIYDMLRDRPSARYDAWQLGFELVKP